MAVEPGAAAKPTRRWPDWSIPLCPVPKKTPWSWPDSSASSSRPSSPPPPFGNAEKATCFLSPGDGDGDEGRPPSSASPFAAADPSSRLKALLVLLLAAEAAADDEELNRRRLNAATLFMA